MAIMVLLCLCACGSLGLASAIAGVRRAVPGLFVLAGVDGAALRAFFKPSLGAAPALPAADRRFLSCTTVVGRDKDQMTRATGA